MAMASEDKTVALTSAVKEMTESSEPAVGPGIAPSSGLDLAATFMEDWSSDDDVKRPRPARRDASTASSGQGSPRVSSSNEGLENVKPMIVTDDLNKTSIPVSYRNAALLNKYYQGHIEDAIDALEVQLNRNLLNQRETLDAISAANRLAKASTSSPTKATMSVFSYPYFKDSRGFSHPLNADTVKKRFGGDESDVYVTRSNDWTQKEKDKLRRLVRDTALTNRSRGIREKQKRLDIMMKKDEMTPAEAEALEMEKRRLDLEVESLSSLSDMELHSNRNEEHDWLHISQAFTNRDPRNCKLMWKNCLHPAIDNSPWVAEEDAALKDLVAKYGSKGRWDDVAAGMLPEYSRTGYQCFARYQQIQKASAEKCVWTEEEDERLLVVVQGCRVENFVPWTKVAFHMKGKSAGQCSKRFTHSLRSDVKKGGFTEAEDLVIIAGVLLFGQAAWALIAEYLPRRSCSQIYSRYKCHLKEEPLKSESSELNAAHQLRLEEKKQRLDAALEQYVAWRELERDEACKASSVRNIIEVKGCYITGNKMQIPKHYLADFMLEMRSRIPNAEQEHRTPAQMRKRKKQQPKVRATSAEKISEGSSGCGRVRLSLDESEVPGDAQEAGPPPTKRSRVTKKASSACFRRRSTSGENSGTTETSSNALEKHDPQQENPFLCLM